MLSFRAPVLTLPELPAAVAVAPCVQLLVAPFPARSAVWQRHPQLPVPVDVAGDVHVRTRYSKVPFVAAQHPRSHEFVKVLPQPRTAHTACRFLSTVLKASRVKSLSEANHAAKPTPTAFAHAPYPLSHRQHLGLSRTRSSQKHFCRCSLRSLEVPHI